MLLNIEKDSARVSVPPPFTLTICVLIGLALNLITPIYLLEGVTRWAASSLLLFSGLTLVFSCIYQFNKVKTNLEPWKTTTSIVTSGPYRFSRNPIYISALLLASGVGFLFNAGWVLIMLLPFIIIIDRTVIIKEERYLSEKFGNVYINYKKQVRRWI